jgi:hypothetical protein
MATTYTLTSRLERDLIIKMQVQPHQMAQAELFAEVRPMAKSVLIIV